jgi:predicted ATPase
MAGFAAAAELYHGDLLQGIYPADSLLFSEWALLKREQLHTEALRALDLLSTYHRRRGELEQALVYARRQLELEPWREEAHLQVMTILALRGERSAAIRQYDRLRKLLMSEVGVEPSDETRLAYERILAARKRRPQPLPQPSTPFLGRKAELNQVAELLSDADCRLLTILGSGGMGKSRLALQAAAAQTYSYLHGVYLVQLVGVNTAGGVLRAIAAALGLHVQSNRDPQTQLTDFLRAKEILLVLDNYEHLLAPGTPTTLNLVDELLSAAPGLRLMVTSRQRLNLTREWTFALHGLSFPPDSIAPVAEAYEAGQLFLQVARRSAAEYQPYPEEMPALLQICRTLEGVPLALELAAALTRVMSLGQIARAIQENLDNLVLSSPDVPERQRSLRATFNHSFQMLAPPEQRALACLAIFPVSFDRSAAEFVAGASLQMLAAFTDRSLIETVRSNQPGARLRYRMHELIKQFSREALEQDGAELAQTVDRHREYFMGMLNARNDKVMGGTESYQAGQEVGIEMDNVRQALLQAIAQGNLAVLGHSLNILMFTYEISGLFEEAEHIFAQIYRQMEQACESDTAAKNEACFYQGRTLMYHGWYCMRLGRLEQAIALTERAIALSRQAGDEEGVGLGLNSLGVLALQRGDFARSKSFLQAALEAFPPDEFAWSRAGALANLGLIAMKEGDLADSEAYIWRSMALYAELNDGWGMAGNHENLTEVAILRGDLDLAEDHARQALAIRQQLGQRWRIASVLTRLGRLAFLRQQYPEAQLHYREALEILWDYGERVLLTETLVQFGAACTALGEFDQAREALRSAVRYARETGLTGTLAKALLGWGELLIKEGKAERTREILLAVEGHQALDADDRHKIDQLMAALPAGDQPVRANMGDGAGKLKTLEELSSYTSFRT